MLVLFHQRIALRDRGKEKKHTFVVTITGAGTKALVEAATEALEWRRMQSHTGSSSSSSPSPLFWELGGDTRSLELTMSMSMIQQFEWTEFVKCTTFPMMPNNLFHVFLKLFRFLS